MHDIIYYYNYNIRIYLIGGIEWSNQNLCNPTTNLFLFFRNMIVKL